MKYGILSRSTQLINVGDFIQWDGILEYIKEWGFQEKRL